MMITFFPEPIRHEPNPVNHAPFDFILGLDSDDEKDIQVTFTIRPQQPYLFIKNGSRQKKISTILHVPAGISEHRVPAQLDGPTGLVNIPVRYTNTADPQDFVQYGVVVRV